MGGSTVWLPLVSILPSVCLFCFPSLITPHPHSPYPRPHISPLNSFYFWSEKFFVSSILYIHEKVQEISEWIANLVQWCEIRQLLLESFPSVITSSPSLPVSERDRGTKTIRLLSTLHSLSTLLSSLTELCVTWETDNLILFVKKKKIYRQADADQTGSSPKRAVVKRPKREAHFAPQSSVEGWK